MAEDLRILEVDVGGDSSHAGRAASVRTHSRLPVIDALRLCAALGVFLFHASAEAGIDKRTMPKIDLLGLHLDRIPDLFTLGATGVSLFFVISGFCLYLSARRKPRSTMGYYTNRVARIYPAYIFALAVSAIIAGLVKSYWNGWDIVIKALFLQGFVQAYNLSINGAFWSMASEVQFYAVFPLLALLMRRLGPSLSLTVALPLCLTFRVVVGHIQGADTVVGGVVRATFLSNLLFGRLLEFVAGMAVASFYLDRPALLRRWSGLVIFPLLAIGYLAKARGTGWLAEPVLGLGYAALLGAAVTSPTHIQNRSPFALMGRASYSLFLIHIPLLTLIAPLILGMDAGPYPRLALMFAIGLLVSGSAAMAMYAWIELPLWTALAPRPQAPPNLVFRPSHPHIGE